MSVRAKQIVRIFVLILLVSTVLTGSGALSLSVSKVSGLTASDNPSRPSASVRCAFIHHSTGQAWLTDGYGNLALVLRDNNYYVSDTNYGWGPARPDGDPIGSHTDIGNWWEWFRGPNSATYLSALYANDVQTFEYSRLQKAPAGQNEIILFKSCFPNSNLKGSLSDPIPPISTNPLRGQDSSSEAHTVANAKGLYLDLLEYFKTRQDKLFVIITAPPVSDRTYANNARAFNQWIVNDYLKNYPYQNVFVFDYYNVLTTNGGNANVNDVNKTTGNHHRWWNNAIQHQVASNLNVTAYPTGDDHPSAAGDVKATSEFVPLLNVAYNRWKASTALTVTATDPVNTAQNVPVTKTINVTFNKKIQQGTNYSKITLKRGTTTVNMIKAISGTTLTLKPNATLAYNATYTVFVPRDGVKNGTIPLATDFTSRFTTAAAPKKATALNASISIPAPLTKQNVTVAGRLTSNNAALSGKTVTLQRSINNAVWSTLTPKSTNATGWYSFSKNETTAGTYYYRTTYAGDATYANATSNVVKVTVKYPTKLTATASTSTSAGKSFSVTGTLTIGSAAITNQNVTLQRSLDNKTWVTLSIPSNKTNATGGYKLTTKEASAGTYYYRAYYAGTPTYAAAASKGVRVAVR